MIIALLTNVSLPKFTDPSPYQENTEQDGDSYHTYVNYYKTHAMATCHGGIGKPLEKDSDPRKLMSLFRMNTRQI